MTEHEKRLFEPVLFDLNGDPFIEPKWQKWTPIEGRYYWIEKQVMYLADPQLETPPHNIEQLLTNPITKPLWEKIELLQIDFKKLIINFEYAFGGEFSLSYYKQSAIDAEIIEKQAFDLLQSMKKRDYYSDYLCKGLNEIINRTQADKRIYKKLKSVVKTDQQNLMDELYFVRKMDEFFKQHTSRRHELTAICYAIAFKKMNDYDKESFKQIIKDKLRN
jgi:hypothetical protein